MALPSDLPDLPDLPVVDILPRLLASLAERSQSVLIAPPGGGKTTLVPLALLDAGWMKGQRILLLEPRRLAARAAATRMARLLGQEVGKTVGYAMRMETRQSSATRILVLTESILTRMIVENPELPGTGAVIFDEFHERSLDADLGLALAIDAQSALRPDLRLLVMSATLDGARVSELLGDAPVVESIGRTHPVELRYRERRAAAALDDSVAAAIRDQLAIEPGGILAFLPGQREIERTAERLLGRVPQNVDVFPLYGQLDADQQDAAIRKAPQGRRKVVLATSVAESSITIDGVRIVIDGGLARLPKYDPASGVTHLETVRVSRASADQRAGRAGRTEPGVAIRLWRLEQTGSLPAFAPPEIVQADLAGMMLECAAAGISDPAMLHFLDRPPPAALAEARGMLTTLGALDPERRITGKGRIMRQLALPARLANMVACAAERGEARQAARLAMLLTERGLGGDHVDLELRMPIFLREQTRRAEQARQLANSIADRAIQATANAPRQLPEGSIDLGRLLIDAWPDRVALARGGRGRFLLANGQGAVLGTDDPLAKEKFIIVADLRGAAADARISSAASVSEVDLRSSHACLIERMVDRSFDLQRREVRARELERLGAIVLSERSMTMRPDAESDRILLAALRQNGLRLLPWDEASESLRQRLDWLHRTMGEPWPDVSEAALKDTLDAWLLPFLSGQTSLASFSPELLRQALLSRVPQPIQVRIDRLAPTSFQAPTGSRVRIRYDGDHPSIAIRVQELYGLTQHPAVAEGAIALTIELLSPANRPIQTTRDLPGFWRGTWAEVRSQMRGRYPRHVWPEDPVAAEATLRAKPRAR